MHSLPPSRLPPQESMSICSRSLGNSETFPRGGGTILTKPRHRYPRYVPPLRKVRFVPTAPHRPRLSTNFPQGDRFRISPSHDAIAMRPRPTRRTPGTVGGGAAFPHEPLAAKESAIPDPQPRGRRENECEGGDSGARREVRREDPEWQRGQLCSGESSPPLFKISYQCANKRRQLDWVNEGDAMDAQRVLNGL